MNVTDLDRIRTDYIAYYSTPSEEGYWDLDDPDAVAERFDAAIREIQAQAWDRGQHAAFGFSVENPHFTPSDKVGTKYDNPYRKEPA